MEERGFDTTVTAGAIHDLLRDAIELVPGVTEFVIDELQVGTRPGTPDNAPLIGAGALDRLFWATGHHRHGILLAPATAEIIAATLLSTLSSPSGGAVVEQPSWVAPELAAAFAPTRFTQAAVTAGV